MYFQKYFIVLSKLSSITLRNILNCVWFICLTFVLVVCFEVDMFLCCDDCVDISIFLLFKLLFPLCVFL